jgi:predicted ArsR family transcriptional regulator
MDVSARPGDALAQPTRARVFALLGELNRPASTEELAAELGMHPNGVRLHLERLREEGLLQRRRERRPRGRPRDSWAISPHAQPGGDPPTGYATLSRWLVKALVTSGAMTEDMEETGRLIGRGMASDHAGPRDDQMLFDTLTTLGFQPARAATTAGHEAATTAGDEAATTAGHEAATTAGDETATTACGAPQEDVTFVLRNCPYRQAVHERQPLVCALHRGLTSGLVGAMEAGSELVGFEAKDPDLAGCIIRLGRPRRRPQPDASQKR